MTKSVLVVILLVVLNGYLPEAAADLTQHGYDVALIHLVAALGTAIALGLNALDPLGKMRRLVEGLDVPPQADGPTTVMPMAPAAPEAAPLPTAPPTG